VSGLLYARQFVKIRDMSAINSLLWI